MFRTECLLELEVCPPYEGKNAHALAELEFYDFLAAPSQSITCPE